MKLQDQHHHPIIIIGTGFGGLSMAINLKKAGVQDFIILERKETAGGTWRDNSYPGAACDVPARLYSLSAAPKTDWSRVYPTQPELKQYQEDVHAEFGLGKHTLFGHAVQKMAWQDDSKIWEVETDKGTYTCNYLITANGGLSEPKDPEIKGLKTFKGKTFHSATWDHDYDLEGKRVAVIGTGASAIQFVPEVAHVAKRLDVYQRTPNWIIPRPDRAISRFEKVLLKFPPYRQLMRLLVYLGHESRVFGIVINPFFMTLFQKVAERHIKRQVKDPELRAKVTPDYLIGCKRILISDEWYPTLCRDHVHLIDSGVSEIRENAVVDANGIERDVDVIIFGTGFHATENPIAGSIFGRDGRCLRDDWEDGEYAYLGVSVHGYPNLFMMAGPNTGTGHTSQIYLLERMSEYILKAIQPTLYNPCVLEVRKDVEDAWNEKLQKILAGSVWSTQCDSWYKHKSGKVTTMWPGFTFTYAWATRHFIASNYLPAVPSGNAAAEPAAK